MTTVAMPEVSVEIAFGGNPASVVADQRNDLLARGLAGQLVWRDVSTAVRKVEIAHGRQYELDRIEAGTARIVLDDRSRRFDPTNTASPWYGSILPMRRVRIAAVWGGTRYELFSGFIEAWRTRYNPGMDAEVHVDASDGLKVLSMVDLDTTFPEQASGARVAAVLDAIGWPATDRSIDTGQSTLQAETEPVRTPALSYLQDVAMWEGGTVYASGSKIVYHDRHRRLRPPYSQVQAVFGDGPGELPYVEIEPGLDERHVYNDITVTQRGGATYTPQRTADADVSQQRYLRRSLSRTLAVVSTLECQDAADFLLDRYAEPRRRIERIVIDPRMDAALWPHVLGRTLGEMIEVRRRPPGGGAASVQQVHIEGIEHRIERGRWETTWQLSPSEQYVYWVLGDTNRSILGTTTRLAY